MHRPQSVAPPTPSQKARRSLSGQSSVRRPDARYLARVQSEGQTLAVWPESSQRARRSLSGQTSARGPDASGTPRQRAWTPAMPLCVARCAVPAAWLCAQSARELRAICTSSPRAIGAWPTLCMAHTQLRASSAASSSGLLRPAPAFSGLLSSARAAPPARSSRGNARARCRARRAPSASAVRTCLAAWRRRSPTRPRRQVAAPRAPLASRGAGRRPALSGGSASHLLVRRVRRSAPRPRSRPREMPRPTLGRGRRARYPPRAAPRPSAPPTAAWGAAPNRAPNRATRVGSARLAGRAACEATLGEGFVPPDGSQAHVGRSPRFHRVKGRRLTRRPGVGGGAGGGATKRGVAVAVGGGVVAPIRRSVDGRGGGGAGGEGARGGLGGRLASRQISRQISGLLITDFVIRRVAIRAARGAAHAHRAADAAAAAADEQAERAQDGHGDDRRRVVGLPSEAKGEQKEAEGAKGAEHSGGDQRTQLRRALLLCPLQPRV